jgi:hypothetical protein
MSYTDNKNGTVGKVDGAVIKEVPASMLVTKFQFMITCADVLIAASKFNMVRTLDDDKDVDGWICQGRRYHDAWVLQQRGTGIRIYTKS